MQQHLDEAAVRHVAELARLRLTDEEVNRFRAQLAAVLDYFEQLQALDTTDVRPFGHPIDVHNVLRTDEPGAAWPGDEALANAPDRQEGFFRVPKVLEQEDV